MKGLVLKEIYSLKDYIKTIVFVLIFFILFCFMGEYNLPLVMLFIFSSLSAISTLSYDENSHWDEYQLTLPISKKTLVGSKYILFLIFILASSVIGIIYISLVCFFDKSVLFSNLASVVFAAIPTVSFLASPIFPLTYKFGANKISIYFAAIGFVPLIFIFLANHIFKLDVIFAPFIDYLNKIESNSLLWLLAISCILISVTLMTISYFVSLNIFKNKEF